MFFFMAGPNTLMIVYSIDDGKRGWGFFGCGKYILLDSANVHIRGAR